MGNRLSEWIGIALGALCTLGAGVLAIWAQRRDRAEDRKTKIEEEVGEVKGDVAHIEGYLEATSRYRPRQK